MSDNKCLFCGREHPTSFKIYRSDPTKTIDVKLCGYYDSYCTAYGKLSFTPPAAWFFCKHNHTKRKWRIALRDLEEFKRRVNESESNKLSYGVCIDHGWSGNERFYWLQNGHAVGCDPKWAKDSEAEELEADENRKDDHVRMIWWFKSLNEMIADYNDPRGDTNTFEYAPSYQVEDAFLEDLRNRVTKNQKKTEKKLIKLKAIAEEIRQQMGRIDELESETK